MAWRPTCTTPLTGASVTRNQSQPTAQTGRVFPTRSNLAGVLVNQGRLYEATEQLRAIVVDAPRYAPAHRNLAALLAQSGKADEAAAHLREAERLEAAGAL